MSLSRQSYFRFHPSLFFTSAKEFLLHAVGIDLPRIYGHGLVRLQRLDQPRVDGGRSEVSSRRSGVSGPFGVSGRIEGKLFYLFFPNKKAPGLSGGFVIGGNNLARRLGYLASAASAAGASSAASAVLVGFFTSCKRAALPESFLR